MPDSSAANQWHDEVRAFRQDIERRSPHAATPSDGGAPPHPFPARRPSTLDDWTTGAGTLEALAARLRPYR